MKVINFLVLFVMVFSIGFAHAKQDGISYFVGKFDGNKIINLESHNIDSNRPIASITKLISGLVFLDNVDNINNCYVVPSFFDIDKIKNTKSRIKVGDSLKCVDMMYAAMMSSDNLAANSLYAPLGITKSKFVDLMNAKAKDLGMKDTVFFDPAGLSPKNKSSVRDLLMLSYIIKDDALLSEFCTKKEYIVDSGQKVAMFRNSNKLIREYGYTPIISKTGYINESGYNLLYVTKDNCNNERVYIVLGARSSNERAMFIKSLVDIYSCDRNV